MDWKEDLIDACQLNNNDNDFYTDGPIECVCGSNNFKYETKDSIANIVCEMECNCKDCGHFLGYWAYGFWQR